MRRKWLAAGAAAVVALAGCGSGNGTEGLAAVRPAAVQDAAAATRAAGTARVETTMTMTIDGNDVTFTADGVTDPENGRSQTSVDMGQVLGQMGEFGGLGAPPGELEELFSDPMLMVTDGTRMFMKFPALAMMLGGGKDWVGFDLAQFADGAGAVFGGGPTPFGTDPSQLLDLLDAVDDMEEIGPEEVRGVPTMHSAGSLTVAELIASVPEELTKMFGGAISDVLPPGAEDTEIPYDVWVDDDGLLRRSRMAMDLSGFATGTGAEGIPAAMTITTEFFDFGQPVGIEVPADDEVVDMTEMFGDMFSSGMPGTDDYDYDSDDDSDYHGLSPSDIVPFESLGREITS
ncbi:MAG: hypothetical protein ACT4PW_12110 [Acidimicrobiia bacterium]